MSAEQTEHIKGQWDKRLSSTTKANLSNSLARVQSVAKTAAYRHTFGHTGTLASMDDTLHAVEEDVAASLTKFATQHVFGEIVTSIGAAISFLMSHAMTASRCAHVYEAHQPKLEVLQPMVRLLLGLHRCCFKFAAGLCPCSWCHVSAVECLEAGLPEVEHAVLQQLVQRVAESCVMPSLVGLVKR